MLEYTKLDSNTKERWYTLLIDLQVARPKNSNKKKILRVNQSNSEYTSLRFARYLNTFTIKAKGIGRQVACESEGV